ncbi:tetratricopeptide repeat protein [Jiulongibacter sediminis]|uniref:tetratricopeptide repeat protein n=1 Tax=Jiulongibacter sediminis TaxID=1605367 RepID=UPI0006DC2B2D|nr:tetratricopeptide repeat protein [Jiulongibacter sediminis]
MLKKLLFFLLACFSIAYAQEPLSETDKRLAGEGVFLLGMKEFMAENYDKAATQFKKVIDEFKPTAGVYHMLAKAYLEQNDLPAAATAAAKSLELEKNNVYYQEFQASLFTALQDYEESIELYKKLIKNDPLKVDNYLHLAEIYVSLGEYKQAIRLYDEVEKNLGTDEEISRRKQLLYLRQDKVEEAIQEGDKLIETQPLEPEYVLKQAQIMMSNQKYNEAESLLKSHLEKDGDLGEAHVMLAEIYRSKGDLKAATDELMLAIENPLLEADVKLQVLGSYIELVEENPVTAQLDKAVNLTEEMIANEPEASVAYVYLANLLVKKGELEKAQENYLKSTQFDKSMYGVWMALIEIDTKLGDAEAMAKHAQEAADYFPNQAFFWYHLGYGNVLLENYEEAIYALEEAQFLSFDNKELLKHIYTLLGDSYNQTKQYTEAEKAYDDALKIDPDYLPVLNNASYYLALRGRNLDKALSMSKHLIELEPDNLEYSDTHAWVLFQKEEYQQAYDVLSAALDKSDEPNGTALEHFGDILSKMGDSEKALEYWYKAKLTGEHSPLLDKKVAEKQYLVE